MRANIYRYRPPVRPISARRREEKQRAFDAGCAAGATFAPYELPRKYHKDKALATLWQRGYGQGFLLAEEDAVRQEEV